MQTGNYAKRYRGRYCLHNLGKRKSRPSALHKNLLDSGGITPLIFNLSTRRRRVANFTLQPCYLGKEAPVPSKQQAGWTSEPLWELPRKVSYA